MCLGKIKSSIVVVTLIATSFWLSSTAFAAPKCSSFLSKTENETLEQNPFEIIQNEIDQAQTLEQANKLTYELVTLGNRVFDKVIDEIIAMNTQPAKNPELAQAQSDQVQFYVDALLVAFRVPSYVMDFAINNRLKIETAEQQQKLQAEQEREAIGFDRSELAKDFHADPPPKQPIGFEIGDTSANARIFRTTKFDIILDNLARSEFEPKNKTEEVEKAPIGFIHPKQDTAVDETAPLDHIGFVKPESVEGAFKKSDIAQVVLNVQVGEFRVLDEAKQSVGF